MVKFRKVVRFHWLVNWFVLYPVDHYIPEGQQHPSHQVFQVCQGDPKKCNKDALRRKASFIKKQHKPLREKIIHWQGFSFSINTGRFLTFKFLLPVFRKLNSVFGVVWKLSNFLYISSILQLLYHKIIISGVYLFNNVKNRANRMLHLTIIWLLELNHHPKRDEKHSTTTYVFTSLSWRTRGTTRTLGTLLKIDWELLEALVFIHVFPLFSDSSWGIIGASLTSHFMIPSGESLNLSVQLCFCNRIKQECPSIPRSAYRSKKWA